MIHTVWPYLALMLSIAGLFPMLERRFGWRLFSVMPPIVMVYLCVTGLAVAGLWQINPEIQGAQKALENWTSVARSPRFSPNSAAPIRFSPSRPRTFTSCSAADAALRSRSPPRAPRHFSTYESPKIPGPLEWACPPK